MSKDFQIQAREWIDAIPVAPLGPGKPILEKKQWLETLSSSWPGDWKANWVNSCQAGFWLAYSFLDESHRLSQDLHSTEGSYWHGIMHRREPDAANSAYWFRRVGLHPVFEQLARQVAGISSSDRKTAWDSFSFIDQCEKYRGSNSAREEELKKIQQMETKLLLEWCIMQACNN